MDGRENTTSVIPEGPCVGTTRRRMVPTGVRPGRGTCGKETGVGLIEETPFGGVILESDVIHDGDEVPPPKVGNKSTSNTHKNGSDLRGPPGLVRRNPSRNIEVTDGKLFTHWLVTYLSNRTDTRL